VSYHLEPTFHVSVGTHGSCRHGYSTPCLLFGSYLTPLSCVFCHTFFQNNLDPEKFLRAPRSVIEHTLAYIEKKFGSIEGYLDQIGFTEDKRVALKKALREG